MAIILTLSNTIFHIIISFLELSNRCLVENSHQCRDVFLDNLSLSFMVFSIIQFSTAVDGVSQENFYELVGCYTIEILTTVGAILVFQTQPPYIITWILLIGSLMFQVTEFSIIYPLYKTYLKRMNRKVGADPKTQDLYKNHLLALSVLKFDFTLTVIVISLAGLGIYNDYKMIIVGVISSLYLLVWFTLGWLAIKKEHLNLMRAFLIGFIAFPIYSLVNFIFVNLNTTDKNDYYLNLAFIIIISGTLFTHAFASFLAAKRLTGFDNGLLTTLERQKQISKAANSQLDEFAQLDSDEEIDLDISLEPGSSVHYQRMSNI